VQLFHGRGESVFPADDVIQLVLEELGVEELLAVFPFVEGLGLIESLVALEADEGQVQVVRRGLGQLRLSHPGGSLDEDRLFQMMGQIDRGGDPAVDDVGHAPVAFFQHRYGGQSFLIFLFHIKTLSEANPPCPANIAR